jgi:hypothetical protein
MRFTHVCPHRSHLQTILFGIVIFRNHSTMCS